MKTPVSSTSKTGQIFNIPRLLLLTMMAWLALVVFTSPPARAGQTCEEHVPNAEALRAGLNLGSEIRDALEASDAEVVLIARVGQDLSQYHLKHSHIGFLVRDGSTIKSTLKLAGDNIAAPASPPNRPRSQWTVFHMLNHCGKPDAGLFAEGLGMFFMDTPFRYEAMVLVPSPAVQARLKILLASDKPQRFKADRYNMLAYPFNPASQNSNQWVLELLTAAISQERIIQSREDAQAYLRYVDFQPSTIHLNTLARLGATLTRQNVNFNDHPFGPRMAGRIDTVTVESVERFLKKRDPGMIERMFSL